MPTRVIEKTIQRPIAMPNKPETDLSGLTPEQAEQVLTNMAVANIAPPTETITVGTELVDDSYQHAPAPTALPLTPETLPQGPGDKIAAPATSVVESARMRSNMHGYAYEDAPTSNNKALYGNSEPGKTKLGYLADQNKCNYYALDSVHDAGYQVPTVKLWGTNNTGYPIAEKLPTYASHFDKVSQKNMAPGDLLVFDYAQKGPSTAHVEIVTEGMVDGKVKTAGAHDDGTYRTTKDLSRFTETDSENKRYHDPVNDEYLYILRPKKLALSDQPIKR